jgi:hypothetical protein
MPASSPVCCASGLLLSSLLALGAGCGGRPASLPAATTDSGAASTDGNGASPDSANGVGECVVAMRLDSCCEQAMPIHAGQLGKDPCLVRYTPYYPSSQVPAVCAARKGDCSAVRCEAAIRTLFAEQSSDGSCVWKSECETNADCIAVLDCREHCCGCGAALPLAYAQAEPCVKTPQKTDPLPAGCQQPCRDYCWGADAPLTAVCVPLSGDPSLRVCRAGR